MIEAHLIILHLPKRILTAHFVGFARHRSYSYASSQELTNCTRQDAFRQRKGS